MDKELQVLKRAHIWDLVPLTPMKVPISCHWVYKIKTHFEGLMERHKARLVTRWFTEECAIDYEGTFAPIAMLTFVWALLLWFVGVPYIRWISIMSLFTVTSLKSFTYNLLLISRILMALPVIFVAPFIGLNKLIVSGLNDFGVLFLRRDIPKATITMHSSHADLVMESPYFFFMLTIWLLQVMMPLPLKHLQRQFEMKYLGPLFYFLGLEVASFHQGYFISQRKFSADLIRRACLSYTCTNDTLIELHPRLHFIYEGPLSDPTGYRRLVGDFVYLTISHPGIANALGMVCQFVTLFCSLCYCLAHSLLPPGDSLMLSFVFVYFSIGALFLY